jgi:hypothetical protein
MPQPKTCLYCDKPLQGRSDKKFCDDQCRNNYNNQLNSDNNNHVRNINNILRRNRRILEELNTTGKTNMPKSKLQERGFNFNYFTNLFKTKEGKTYFFCYEQGYLPLDNDWYLLVRQKQ